MSEPKPIPVTGRLPTPEECRAAVRWAVKQGLIRLPAPPIDVLDLSADLKEAMKLKTKAERTEDGL